MDGQRAAGNCETLSGEATRAEARGRARLIGFDHVTAVRATASELDELKLPPSALGIEGDSPWWHPETNQEPPCAPKGDPGSPVYLEAGNTEDGPLMHAWGAVYDYNPVTGAPVREYLGVGYLVGTIQRERNYGSGGDVFFEIGDEYRDAVASDDIKLPIVEVRAQTVWEYAAQGPDIFLPEYPRCPDCGGRIEWAEAGRVPGSRRCAGGTEPDMRAAGSAASPPGVTSDRTAGCGSTFVDTRYGVASPVPKHAGDV